MYSGADKRALAIRSQSPVQKKVSRVSIRIILSTVAAPGHLFPMLPLGRAFLADGHAVGVLTSKAMTGVIEPEGLETLAAGPSQEAVVAEVARRHGDDVFRPTADGFGEMFGGARLDLTADEALDVAATWRPDLVLHEYTDAVGPLVATALGVPFATMAPGPAMPPPLTAAVTGMAAQRYAERGLTLPAGGAVLGDWYIDSCPPALQVPGWSAPAPRLALRPEPYAQPWAPRPAPRPSDRPAVLVSFGTNFNSPAVVSPVARALASLDADIVATVGPGLRATDFEVGHRVRLVPFTPQEQLLDGVAVVVTHGGIGTVLGALSRGIPLVIVPQAADQFMQAKQVTAAGAGIALLPGQADPDAVAEAARRAMTDPGIRSAAARLRDEIGEMPAPSAVARQLASTLVAAGA
jgi:UDP:flavonoid glycosyltransferase YjiC (YdhE family)